MATIITIGTQKGGVGKSTTAGALTAGLTLKGYKTLCIDLDPQTNMTATVAGLKILADKTPSSYEVITDRVSATDAVIQTSRGDIIKGSENLIKVESEITETGREYRLKEALADIQKSYDFIVIDTPPSLGILLINALASSDYLIIPTLTDLYCLQAIGQLYKTVQVVQAYCNKDLRIAGLLITQHNGRVIVNKDVAKRITKTAEQIGTKVFDTIIRYSTVFREATVRQRDIITYSPRSKPAQDYVCLVDEVIERCRK
ncbi:MAG: ParA family protein [Bacteroidia bacterium]|nr:ParA family protein [Bacteroidia bacterium]